MLTFAVLEILSLSKSIFSWLTGWLEIRIFTWQVIVVTGSSRILVKAATCFPPILRPTKNGETPEAYVYFYHILYHEAANGKLTRSVRITKLSPNKLWRIDSLILRPLELVIEFDRSHCNLVHPDHPVRRMCAGSQTFATVSFFPWWNILANPANETWENVRSNCSHLHVLRTSTCKTGANIAIGYFLYPGKEQGKEPSQRIPPGWELGAARKNISRTERLSIIQCDTSLPFCTVRLRFSCQRSGGGGIEWWRTEAGGTVYAHDFVSAR